MIYTQAKNISKKTFRQSNILPNMLSEKRKLIVDLIYKIDENDLLKIFNVKEYYSEGDTLKITCRIDTDYFIPVPIIDRPPDSTSKLVICFGSFGSMICAYRSHAWNEMKPTHWMDIPETP